MIRTPSLRARVLLTSLAALALVTITLDSFVFVSLRARLRETLVEVLDAREEVARRLGDGEDARDLAQELAAAGIPAVVTDTAGQIFLSDPPGRSFGVVPPGSEGESSVERRAVVLSSGITVEVQVASGGVETTLQRLLLLESVGTAAVLGLAFLVLRRVSKLVTRPVERIVEVADAITHGRTGERLDPSDPTTELGRMAAAFDRTIDAMEEALADARKASESTQRFLSDAAHQLRTPMAGLRASAESLLRDPESPERDAMLANIARESVRATRLVESLLRVARLESGETRNLEIVDVLMVVREEKDRASALAPDLDITLETTGRDFTIQGDRLALKDAIANLLDNARRFAGSSVDLAVAEDVGAIEVSVRDDGPGVPSGDEAEVFSRFVSLDGTGSGLGLAIARAVARAHGGDITVHGSRFEVFLPRAEI